MAPSRGDAQNRDDTIPLVHLVSTNDARAKGRSSESSNDSRTSSQLEVELNNLLGADHTSPSEPLLPEPSSSRLPRHSSFPSTKSFRRLNLRYIRPRLLLVILIPVILVAAVGRTAYHYLSQIPSSHYRSAALHHSPEWATPWMYKLLPYEDGNYAPRLHSELLDAPWAGSWTLPMLGPPRTASGPSPLSGETEMPRPSDLTSAAFLMLHVFSTPTAKSRASRAMWRRLSPVHNVDPGWRHLIDIRFIVGRHDPSTVLSKENVTEELMIDREVEQYGDVVRLDGLYGGENMNRGKSWEWINWVGRGGPGREVWWVFKCDEDTLPILPNLLDYLLALSPGSPSYVGTSLGHYWAFLYYFEGMMYGLSWGVVKTIASAQIDVETIHTKAVEDARIGELMYSLPSSPSCERLAEQHRANHEDGALDICNASVPALGDWRMIPPSPDPRTGLSRLDLQHRLSDYHQWWTASAKTAVGWHDLKDENDYLKAHAEVQASLRQQHREIWVPPISWDRYKDTWESPKAWSELPEQMTMTQGTNDWSTAIVQGS